MKTEIKKLRQKMKMTQGELADKVEVTRQTINALEQGRYNPSLELAWRITKALKQNRIERVFKLK